MRDLVSDTVSLFVVISVQFSLFLKGFFQASRASVVFSVAPKQTHSSHVFPPAPLWIAPPTLLQSRLKYFGFRPYSTLGFDLLHWHRSFTRETFFAMSSSVSMLCSFFVKYFFALGLYFLGEILLLKPFDLRLVLPRSNKGTTPTHMHQVLSA